MWLGKVHLVPKAVINKVQIYTTPKTVKEVQGFVDFWGEFRGLLFSTWYSASVS